MGNWCACIGASRKHRIDVFAESIEPDSLICSPNADEPDPSADECVVRATGPEKDQWALLGEIIEAFVEASPKRRQEGSPRLCWARTGVIGAASGRPPDAGPIAPSLT
jgi:hypothetical protein